MNCEREAEVWRAIDARHWPERCDDELREHVASCDDCADLVEVASVLSEENEEALRTAHVPPSGAVWWRTQMRARQDAARVARRAISVMQAAAVLLAVVGAGFALTVFGGLAWITQAASQVHISLPVLVALAIPLLLAPVAVWFAVTED